VAARAVGRYGLLTHDGGPVFAAKSLKLDLGGEPQLMQARKPRRGLRSRRRRELREAGTGSGSAEHDEAAAGRGVQTPAWKALRARGEHGRDPRTYKPDPRAYQLGVDAFRLGREEILFAPFAGWDAAGARAFGYPTFWVNRLGLPAEELGEVPDAMGKDLTELVRFVKSPR
jgi:2-haloacid dehalogenase